MTLQETLKNLPEPDKEQLRYANEHTITQQIKVDGDGTFIGVHVVPNPEIEILETSGSWSLGKRK